MSEVNESRRRLLDSITGLPECDIFFKTGEETNQVNDRRGTL